MRLVNYAMPIFFVTVVIAAVVGTYGNNPQAAGPMVVIGIIIAFVANASRMKVYVRDGGRTFHRRSNCNGHIHPVKLKHELTAAA